MTNSTSQQAEGGRDVRYPPLSPSLSKSSSSQQHPRSSQLLTSTTSPLLPPPAPTRIHSYHHPISSSYTSSNSFLDRSRPPPPSWKDHRSPPLEHRSSENAAGFSRILPPLPGSSFHSYQLPPLSASLPPSSSWNGTEHPNGSTQRDLSTGGSYATGKETRPDSKLPSLSSHLGDWSSQRSSESASLGSPTTEEPGSASRKVAKAHVPSACLNCKRAHLACDVGRPCRRCINLGKSDTCIDVQHKKRGRPRLKDRPASQTGVTTLQTLDAKADPSTSPASGSYPRHSPSSEPGFFRSPPRAADLLSPPLPSTGSVVKVAGSTHGPGTHSRSASASVSASSYPYSRPDHLRYQMDMSGPPSSAYAQHPSQSSESGFSAIVTMICSTNLQCARISEECFALLGYHPNEIIERSLFELVHPSETGRLEEIWTSLIDPVGVVPQSVPAAADVVMNIPAARLMTPAAGTIFVQENMRLRQRNGMYDFYSVRLHLGGGFGVDLYRRETLDRAYIVASLLKLGNDAAHPDPAILRSPYAQEHGHGRGFRTPAARTPPLQAEPLQNSNGWSAPTQPPRSFAESNDASQRQGQGAEKDAHVFANGRELGRAQSQSNGNTALGVREKPQGISEDRSENRRKRSKIETEDVEGSKAASRPPPSDRSVHTNGANTGSYSGKTSVYSPSSAVRSLLTERSRASSRDGILC